MGKITGFMEYERHERVYAVDVCLDEFVCAAWT